MMVVHSLLEFILRLTSLYPLTSQGLLVMFKRVMSYVCAGFILVQCSSCSMIFRQTFDITDLQVEKRSNGYFVQIAATRDLHDIEALLVRGSWLVVTIAGVKVDFERLRSIQPDDVLYSVEVTGFRTSVQLTIKLRRDFESCQVVQDQKSSDVLIVLHPRERGSLP